MTAVAFQKKIASTYINVGKFSISEKKDPLMNEERINAFLDAINTFKDHLSKKTVKIDKFIEGAESLTWFDDQLDNDTEIQLNNLIASIRELHYSLIRQYIGLEKFRNQGIAKSEIKEFKAAIDDLRELSDDLENIFFFLPNLPEFGELEDSIASL